jgi:predicted RNA methylase
MNVKEIEELDKLVWDRVINDDKIKDTLARKCHSDERRTRSLMTIIARTLKPNSIVCELGGGTGILGFTASAAGAKNVIIVEINPDLVNSMKETALALDYESVDEYLFAKADGRTVEIHQGDALTFDPTLTNPGKKLDALIVEMIGTTLAEEKAVPAYQNIRRYAKSDAQCYPAIAELKVSIAETKDKQVYSSQPVMYHRVDFMKEEATGVDKVVRIPVDTCIWGKVAYVNFDTDLVFPGGLRTKKFNKLCPTWDLDFVNYEELPGEWLNYGDTVNVRIKYDYGKYREDVVVEFLNVDRFTDGEFHVA